MTAFQGARITLKNKIELPHRMFYESWTQKEKHIAMDDNITRNGIHRQDILVLSFLNELTK